MLSVLKKFHFVYMLHSVTGFNLHLLSRMARLRTKKNQKKIELFCSVKLNQLVSANFQMKITNDSNYAGEILTHFVRYISQGGRDWSFCRRNWSQFVVFFGEFSLITLKELNLMALQIIAYSTHIRGNQS